MRLTVFFSGSGGGWLFKLLNGSGRGEPGFEAAGLLGNGEEQDIRVASRGAEKRERRRLDYT